jgi:hypothetical protein
MADIYDRAKAQATRMLAPRNKGGKGAEMILTRKVTGAYDPATGKPTVTITQFTGSAFRDAFELKSIDGTLIRRGDVQLLVSPVQVSGEDMPKPLETDTVVFDGVTYTVVAVQPWDYAGVAVGFEVQARA